MNTDQTVFDRKKHWEKIYETKQMTEVSWYQPTPETSLALIENAEIKKDAKIIDVGGGDSFLVDNLLSLGFTDVTVLDISEKAIERAKNRLGSLAKKVTWIVADAANFEPTEKYDLWHDRAAFHFLTQEVEIEHYVNVVSSALTDNGTAIIGTFSDNGPLKCSGIEVSRYSSEDLASRFEPHLKTADLLNINHQTPFDTTQNFTFCSFRKTLE